MSIKIKFVDFWPGFSVDKMRLYQVLSKHFSIEVSDTPEYVIFSDYSTSHLDYGCVRIHYSAENVRPDFRLADFAIGYDYCADERYFRYPLYVEYRNDVYNEAVLEAPLAGADLDAVMARKKKLCCFIVSNGRCEFRNAFFRRLNARSPVDSAGSFANNIGYRVADKIEFMKDYKFIIAFENVAFPGYTTEKVVHPFYSRTVPIYWGNPKVDDELNPRSFIWVRGPADVDDAIERVLRLDRDDAAYRELLQISPFYESRRNIYYSEGRIAAFFEKVFARRASRVSVKARALARQKDRLRRQMKRCAAWRPWPE